MSPLSACSGVGGVSAAVTAALHFFAASQCLMVQNWPQQDAPANGSHFDFVVVGGGTAGAAVAARLAHSGLYSVLLLEAGPDAPAESVIPGFRDTLKASRYDWNFTSVKEGEVGAGLESGQRQPRGKVLGGSGSINDMVYSRGFPADYHDWATELGPDWSWENVLEYFKKTEHMTDENIINNEELMKYHGVSGEIEVSGSKDPLYETKVFLEAFQEVGFDKVDDMTYPHKIGVGRYSHTIRDGHRDSSLTGLLNKVKDKNITVLKEAMVTRVLIENNKAIGVQVVKDNDSFSDTYHYYADKEVIVSAGTFNTAKLLMLSGIGHREHLESLDIDVVSDLPVGDNLHDHVMYLNFIAADKGTCDMDEATQHMNMIQYLYDRSGIYGNSDSMGALFALNNSLPNIPDFGFYPTCVPQNTPYYEGCVSVIGFKHEICSQLAEELENNEIISIAVVLLKPKSRGKVRLGSIDPFTDPLIYSGTFANEVDLDGFPEAVDVVQALTKTKYFAAKNARYIDIRVKECEDLVGKDRVKCKAKGLATSAWHAVGTAAMGSVVDSKLRVLGVDNLRVVDASVMPRVIRGNTNAPVLMIGEKAADFIMASYGAE